MWRHIASNALTIIALLAFLLAGAILWGRSEYNKPGPLSEAICLQIRPGSSFQSVSEDLVARGAVSNDTILRLGADYSDKSDDLKAGSWLLPEQVSMHEITDIITRGGASTCGTEIIYRVGVTRSRVQMREISPETGRYEEVAAYEIGTEAAPAEFSAEDKLIDARYRVAVAEGVTSWQVTNALKQIDLLEGDADVPAEGSLAPDSYEFTKGDTRESLIERMRAAQATILANAWENRNPDVPVKTPEEALTLASIVEKETGIAEERGVVAGVFVNRLRAGMKLQTDPTVIYGITNGEGVLGRGLRRSELRSPTPYNTYVINALPPTPIANPGKASIEAALNPEETDYLFFVADGTGGHVFAETLDEHNANVRKWRQIEANQ